MYAVEKLGSYISTVSGPFHPFGGAVDIIVVEQQDGSFRTSPWYVRFGKFQGVLKTREKEVKISVNGVEAGFNMFLDAKGEAFFLRADNAGEAACVLSSTSSGDEMDSKLGQSLLVEGGAIKPLATNSTDGGPVVARTNSKRSAFLGFMFGGKPMKDEQGTVDMQSSLDQSEIAADLLEMKWSTNLSSNRMRQKKPLEKSEVNVSVADKEQSSVKSLPTNGHSYAKVDEKSTSSLIRSSSDQLGDSNTLLVTITEEMTVLHSSEAGDLADMTSLASYEASKDRVVDYESFNLNYNLSSGDSSISHAEKLDNSYFNDTASNNFLGRVSSLEESGDIYSLKADIVSNIIAAETRDLVHVASGISSGNQTESTSERLDDSIVKGCTLEVEEEAIMSSVDSQRADNSNINLHVSGVETSIDARIPSSGPQCCDIIVNGPVHDNSDYFSNPYMQECEADNSYVSQISQHSDMNNDSLLDTEEVKSVMTTEQTLIGLSYSPNLQLLSSESGICCVAKIATEFPGQNEEMEKKLDYCRNQLQIKEKATVEDSSFSIYQSCILMNCVDDVESEKDSRLIMPSMSSEKSCEKQLEGVVSKLTLAQDNNICQKHDTDAQSKNFILSNAPVSESLDEIQFPFSDSDSFSGKEVSELSNDDKIVDEEDLMLTPVGEEIVDDLNCQNDEPHSNPVKIPGNGLLPSAALLPTQSLPILRSNIDDIERLNLHYPLSCSLDANSDISELDVCKKESSFSSCAPVESQNNSIKMQITSNVEVESARTQKEIPANANVELSLCKHLLYKGMGAHAAHRAFDAEKVNLETFRTLGPSLVKNNRLVVRLGGYYFPWDAAAPIILGMVTFGEGNIFEPQGMIQVEKDEQHSKGNGINTSTTPGGSWRLWPFSLKRSRTVSTKEASTENTNDKGLDSPRINRNIIRESVSKKVKMVRCLTPTSEELASLNLKEGRNVVTFSFLTSMLGLQQVDARIYLWKWNTRIVISDVDGTITKSDVLGQFMPLVGVDWSQSGVAHLFSAIKGNGYQLLFLSARAISQAHITRQFLFNLKQDGKALPDGPVVISPDGLFPSLFREVIRRAPHEFKISCLEAIKALFPSDCNPFYAGFGNRDTDEISYLKVGIPLGKIFIINPKGQVAVNRQVETRSYTSLHELVNGMFPPMTSTEQEDYNSWNYWKMPLPEIE